MIPLLLDGGLDHVQEEVPGLGRQPVPPGIPGGQGSTPVGFLVNRHEARGLSPCPRFRSSSPVPIANEWACRGRRSPTSGSHRDHFGRVVLAKVYKTASGFLRPGGPHDEVEWPGLHQRALEGLEPGVDVVGPLPERVPARDSRAGSDGRSVPPRRARCGRRSARFRLQAWASHGPPGSQPSAVAEAMFTPAASRSAANVPSDRPSAMTSYRPSGRPFTASM